MKLCVGFILYQDATLKYLEYFLPSLRQALVGLANNTYQIFAFDNSNKNDNRNRLALEFFNHKNNFSIQYLSQGSNLGFAQAYNLMIEEAVKLGAEYFLIINPDTIIAGQAINVLVNYLETNTNISAVSPKILRWEMQDFLNKPETNADVLNFSKIIDTCGLQKKIGVKFYDVGQGELDQGQFDHTNITAPSGAAALFRMSVLRQLKDSQGYFDQRFFMYKEDCDLAYRLFLLNLKTKLVPEALIYHHRTLSKQIKRKKMSKTLRAWSFRNQHLLFIKYFKHEKLMGKLLIIWRILALFIYSLLFEQFNLKEYKNLFKIIKNHNI